MFKLVKVASTEPAVLISLKGKEDIEFVVDLVLNKKIKGGIESEKQYYILNKYVESRGQKYMEELYEVYRNAYDEIAMQMGEFSIEELPDDIIHKVIDKLEISVMEEWLTTSGVLKVPSNMPDVFDQRLSNDGIYTEAQTYTKGEYISLVVLMLVSKASLPLLGELALIAGVDLPKNKEDVLASMITSHSIYNKNGVVKLKGMIEHLIKIAVKDELTSAAIVLEKNVSRDLLPDHVLAVTMIKRLTNLTIVDDNENRNSVSLLFQFINNVIRPNGGVSTAIRAKKETRDNSGNEHESTSAAEVYTINSDLPAGIVEEFKYYTEDVNLLVSHLDVEIDPVILEIAFKNVRTFDHKKVEDFQIETMGIIFKEQFNPMILKYLEGSYKNILAIGYAYLWAIGFKKLAVILTGVFEFGTGVINSRSNNKRLSTEAKERLNQLFPLHKEYSNVDKIVNSVEQDISTLANNMLAMKWVANTTKEHLEEAELSVNTLPNDLRVMITDMVIDIETRREHLDV
jgi:hypothetical protein